MSRLKKALTNLVLKSGLIDNYPNSFYPINSNRYDILGKSNGFKYGEISDDRLINEGYASNTHLFSIINKIKNLSSNGIYKVMVETPDGLEEDTESDLYQLLQKPNDYQTFDEWLDSTLTMLTVTGDNFILGNTSIGFGSKIMNIETLPSNITEVLVSNSTYNVLGYEVSLNGRNVKYNTDEVYHGKLYNPTICGLEGHRGMSPLQAGYRTLVADNELVTAEASFYMNKGVSGIISNGSEVNSIGLEEAKQIDEALRQKLGGSHKSNGVITTGANVNYTAIGMSPSDMQMLQSGDIKLRNLCMLYGLDSKLFGDPKASTYNNFSEAQKGAWTNCIIPYNNRIVGYLNDFVTPTHSAADNRNYTIVYDTSHIEDLQKDKKTEAEKNKIVIEGLTSLITSNLSDEAKVLMITKLYDIEESEAQTLIENGNDSGETDNGTNQEVEGENNEEEDESTNNN